MFNNISNIQEPDNFNDKSLRHLPEEYENNPGILDEENGQEDKENQDTINRQIRNSRSSSLSKQNVDLANLNRKRKPQGNFDSFLHNETLKNEKISVSPLHHGFSFRNKISNNIDHYELENLIANYQETSTSLTPIPVNKTIGYPKDSPKSMNDLSYLKMSQRGLTCLFKPNEFFSNQTFLCPAPKIHQNKESFHVQSKDFITKKNMTCESEKITEILRGNNNILNIGIIPKIVAKPLVQSKNSYLTLARKITDFNSKNLKRIKTNAPITFHFEKTEKNTKYLDILRKTFNKAGPSPRNTSISNISNKEKALNKPRKIQMSARNRTQEKKPNICFNTIKQPFRLPLSTKRIPTEVFIDNQIVEDNKHPISFNNAQKVLNDRLAAPKIKLNQKPTLNLTGNLEINKGFLVNTRKEIHEDKENTQISNNTTMNLYDKINIGEFKMEKVLGQGSYASVKLAFEKASNKKFAIKIYEKYRLTDPHRMTNVKREITILKKMDHRNIIKLFYALDEKRQIFLIMEYIGHMSLHAYLKTKLGRKMDEKEAKKLFFQIVQALNYCHSKNIVHRDIKLENILLDEHMTIKMIDFGFSIVTPATKKLNIFCGTPSYMAPEIVNKSLYNGHATDVWALGILLYVLLHGNFPFKGVDDKDLFRKIGKGKFDINEGLSKECKGLLNGILRVNPSERINTNQILQSSWFF